MSDRSVMLRGFRERLARLQDEHDLTQAELARRAGVDRSTLSQLLSPANRRLPRADTLIALSQATGASIDWLLGVSNEGQARAELVVEQATRSGELTDLDEMLIRWFRDAEGMKIRYLPASLPDLVKTEAIIHHETDRFHTISPAQKLETATAPLRMARAPGSDVECCNSVQALEGFARGEELWSDLDVTARVRQLDRMIELCEELYPTFRWFLYDARSSYAAPITIFGLDRVVLYLGQMYLVLSNREQVVSFVRQFDQLVRAAVVQPPDVPDLLRELRAELLP